MFWRLVSSLYDILLAQHHGAATATGILYVSSLSAELAFSFNDFTQSVIWLGVSLGSSCRVLPGWVPFHHFALIRSDPLSCMAGIYANMRMMRI